MWNWLEDLAECIGDMSQRAGHFLKLASRRLINSSVLTLAAAIASAVATCFSYLAAERSVQVAAATKSFSEKVNADQLALARPSIAILGGSVSPAYQEQSRNYLGTPETVYRVEVRLRNSGGRNARPVWVQVRRGNWLTDSVGSFVLSELPKDVDLPVMFETKDKPWAKEIWLVGVAFGDDIPFSPAPTGETTSGQSGELKRHCFMPVVMQMVASWEPSSSNTNERVLLSAGSPRFDPSITTGVVGNATLDAMHRPVESLRESVRILQVAASSCDTTSP